MKIQSRICLPFYKCKLVTVYCILDHQSNYIRENLDNNLVRTGYMADELKVLKMVGSFFLGISWWSWNLGPEYFPMLMEILNRSFESDFIISQHSWKNAIVNPVGPSASSTPREKTTTLISSFSDSLSNQVACSWDKCLPNEVENPATVLTFLE